MDVDDTSLIKSWEKGSVIAEQKATIQAASKLKGEQLKDRKRSVQDIGNALLRQPGSFNSSEVYRRNLDSFYTLVQMSEISPYPPSLAPLKSLKKIYLQDLCLETHHRGSYVLLRVSIPPFNTLSLLIVMEDEKDVAVALEQFQEEDEKHRIGGEAAQMGHVCMVKEPYVKIVNKHGDYVLRVDHPSDIIWLSADDERIPPSWRAPVDELEKTAEILKEKGKLAFNAGKLKDAIHSYTLALHGSPTFEISQTLYLNRSLVNIKLRRYDNALEDIGKLAADAQQSEKASYRAALCTYKLGGFRECHQALESLLSRFPDFPEAKSMILRTAQRLREQQYGEYDFQAMYKAAKDTPPCLDNATFADNVEIKDSNGRGRGLFTTKDMNAGDLLLCEKAFSYCSSDDRRTVLRSNADTKRVRVGTQMDLVTVIVQKIFHNPSLMPEFMSLDHGDYKAIDEIEVDGMPVVDSFLVDHIVSLNAFGSPRTSLENQSIRLTAPLSLPTTYDTCGIFIKASSINHSCDSNAQRSFIGDMQIIRATRNIAAGSEVLFQYVAPQVHDTYETSQGRLKKWRFECTCLICRQNKKTKKPFSAGGMFCYKTSELFT